MIHGLDATKGLNAHNNRPLQHIDEHDALKATDLA